MPAPVQAHGYTGELSARGTAVPDRKFYEGQATPAGETAASGVWDDLPSHPVSRRQIDLKGFTAGSLVSLRVRAPCAPVTPRLRAS